MLISAGEASGDMYGAQLIESLRRRDPALTFFGAGGERMRAAGCDIVVDAKDLAVVGITEVVSHLKKILGLYRNLIREADERRPALAVVIDSPAFNWRVARQMRKRGIPVVYYVCPQFWAWRQGRVKLLRKYIDKALVIFPFEEKFYRDRGVDTTFVGHPLADLPMPAITRADYAAQHSLDPRQAVDHAHARQPPQRSPHEPADDSGSDRAPGTNLRIPTAGGPNTGGLVLRELSSVETRQAASLQEKFTSSPTRWRRFTTPEPPSSPAAPRRLKPRSWKHRSSWSTVFRRSPMLWANRV